MFNKNGIIQGVCIQNDNRVQELNNRIYNRNIPSHNLQSQFDPRPVRTRQILFPTIDCHLDNFMKVGNNIEQIQIQENYSQQTIFNPGTKAPYSGYATSIDNESRLHGSFMPNQKNTPQSEYIPSSQSDMYNVEVTQRPNIQTHPMLFRQEVFNHFNPNCGNMGRDFFNNHTRQQVKNLQIH